MSAPEPKNPLGYHPVLAPSAGVMVYIFTLILDIDSSGSMYLQTPVSFASIWMHAIQSHQSSGRSGTTGTLGVNMRSVVSQ